MAFTVLLQVYARYVWLESDVLVGESGGYFIQQIGKGYRSFICSGWWNRAHWLFSMVIVSFFFPFSVLTLICLGFYLTDGYGFDIISVIIDRKYIVVHLLLVKDLELLYLLCKTII